MLLKWQADRHWGLIMMGSRESGVGSRGMWNYWPWLDRSHATGNDITRRKRFVQKKALEKFGIDRDRCSYNLSPFFKLKSQAKQGVQCTPCCEFRRLGSEAELVEGHRQIEFWILEQGSAEIAFAEARLNHHNQFPCIFGTLADFQCRI